MTKDLFKSAIRQMIADGEFEKILATQKSISDKKKVKSDMDMLKDVEKKCGIENIMFVPLLTSIKSIDVFRDIIMYMVLIERKIAESV